MKKKTRNAIETLTERLRYEDWELDADNTIRCTGIADTAEHAELRLCPVAAAVAYAPTERIEALLDDPNHETFSSWVKDQAPEIRDHLVKEQRGIEPEMLDTLTTSYAAASVINNAPEMPEAGIILGLGQKTIERLVNDADYPTSRTGRKLAARLASGGNFLREQYESAYGQLPAAG